MSNTAHNRYGSIAAEIYDLDKPLGSLGDTRVYLERFGALREPILEPGCGSGRMLVALLEAGCDVTGFDASPEMLEQCRRRCAERGLAPDLSVQRFGDFHYDRVFAAIIMPVSSFTLVADFDLGVAVLQRCHAHLRPGGVLVMEIEPLGRLADTADDRRQWTAADGDLLTLDGQHVATDWIGQRREMRYRYERWRDGRLVETQIEPWVQRFWGIEELRLAMMAAGFGKVEVWGNFDRRRAPRAGDRVLTFEAVA